MRRCRPIVLALLLGAAILPAQRRQPLLGDVVDGDGTPVADAAVTLVAESDAPDLQQPLDLCRATTDASGRFVASALTDRRYVAFASAPERDGIALVSRLAPGVHCDQRTVLRLEVPGCRRRLAMPLAAGWFDVPGLHVRMRFDGAAGHHVVLPIAEGGIELPPTAAIARFSLHDADGAFLGTIHVPAQGDDTALVPSPMQLAVRVVDAGGAPIAGAHVTVHDASNGADRTGRTATTDAAGRCSVLWGGWRDPFKRGQPLECLYATATAPGCAEGASGWVCKEPFVGYEVVARHKARELVIPLAAQANRPTGRVDPKFAGKHARLDVLGLVRSGPKMYYLPRRYDVVIGADGDYELPQLPPSASAVQLHLPDHDGRTTDLLPTQAPLLPTASKEQCVDIVGQVIDQGGGPATKARILLAGHDVAMRLQWLTPDRSGRFERTLQRGRWTLLAMDDTGWTSHEIDCDAAGPIALRLQAKPQRRVRVEDQAGNPVAGATFEPGDFRMPSIALTTPDAAAVLWQLGWNTFADHMRRVRTNDRGEATLHFLPWPTATPTAFAFVGSHLQRSDDVVIEAGDDVIVFVLASHRR